MNELIPTVCHRPVSEVIPFPILRHFSSILDTTRHFLYFITVFIDLLFLRSFNAVVGNLRPA